MLFLQLNFKVTYECFIPGQEYRSSAPILECVVNGAGTGVEWRGVVGECVGESHHGPCPHREYQDWVKIKIGAGHLWCIFQGRGFLFGKDRGSEVGFL